MTTVGNKTIWEFMNASLSDCSYRTRWEQIALSMVFVGYTIVGILGNALVLVSIIRIRRWSGLERAMMCFLTNLAISDFLLCLITFPATAISAVHDTWVLGIDLCWIVGFAVSYLRIVSILFMMWIGIHRAFVIKYPFGKKITRGIARGISVGVWGIATVPQITCYIGISPMHYDPNRAVCIASMISDNMLPVMVYSFLYIVVPMGTIIGVYSLLLYIAIGAVRKTKTLTELQNNDNETRGRGMSVAHRRAFGTVFAQIGGFLLCFLPFVIFMGLSTIDREMIPLRVQVYGACSSSMSAIINPIIYMNTNKTFKKFVINLLKCKQIPASGNSTAAVSQTFRNPSAVVENRVIRTSTTTCVVGYNQNGPSYSSGGKQRAHPAAGYTRSKSETTVPHSNLLHPDTNYRLRTRAGNKRVEFQRFQSAPECPETNDTTRSSASSEYSSDTDTDRRSSNAVSKTLQSSDFKPQIEAEKTCSNQSITAEKDNTIVPKSRLVRSVSEGLLQIVTNLQSSNIVDNEKLACRSLDNFTDGVSNGIKHGSRVISPEVELRNIVDLDLNAVQQNAVSLISDIDDSEMKKDDLSEPVSLVSIADCECETHAHDDESPISSPVLSPASPALSPAKIPDIPSPSPSPSGSTDMMNQQIIKLDVDDFYKYRNEVSEMEEDPVKIKSNQGISDLSKAPLACSPRISVNSNRWVSLNR